MTVHVDGVAVNSKRAFARRRILNLLLLIMFKPHLIWYDTVKLRSSALAATVAASVKQRSDVRLSVCLFF